MQTIANKPTRSNQTNTNKSSPLKSESDHLQLKKPSLTVSQIDSDNIMGSTRTHTCEEDKSDEQNETKNEDFCQNIVSQLENKTQSIVDSYFAKQEQSQVVNRISDKEWNSPAMVDLRSQNRKEINRLVKKIVSLEILTDFPEDQHQYFKQLPLQFNSYRDYFNMWQKLFYYEIHNILTNSQDSEAKKESAYSASMSFRQPRRQLHWLGYVCLAGETQNGLQSVLMYDKPPHQKWDASDKPSQLVVPIADKQINERFEFRQIKEDDLIVLSEETINLSTSRGSLKRKSSHSFLSQLFQSPSTMFAYIQNRRGKGDDYVQCIVDQSYRKFFTDKEQKTSFVRMNAYVFDSLSTSIREFKTIRMVEFYKFAQILVNPVQKVFNDHSDKAIQKQLSLIKQGENFKQMQMFLSKYKQNFNSSQFQVLNKVTEMPENDIMLIQGPPGTGKTQTITGIISMLIASGVSKILVCAPSNAGVDEVISRLSSQGLLGVTQDPTKEMKDYVLRLGSIEYEPSKQVKQHLLDERLKEKLFTAKIYSLRQTLTNVDDLQKILPVSGNFFPKMNQEHKKAFMNVFREFKPVKKFLNQSLDVRQKDLIKKKTNLERQITLMEKEGIPNRKPDYGDWKYEENALVIKTKIISTTLSMAGIDKMQLLKDQLDYLIVDEACQAIELSSLIPFQLNPKRVILVGDQNQLASTTFSENANQTNFDRSLFERLLLSGYKKTMLTIQYRMHPMIREFPSNTFYDAKIEDGQSVLTRKLPDQIKELQEHFRSSMFLDLVDSQESNQQNSKCNIDEAKLTLSLVKLLVVIASKEQGLKALAGRIGIITPYKSQVKELKDLFSPWTRRFPGCGLTDIEINTVDAFQGREKEIIIFNCVRSNYSESLKSSLGFLIDKRRLNVAITRPKHFLFIIGNSRTLRKSDMFNKMIDHHIQRAQNGGYFHLHKDNVSEQMLPQALLKQMCDDCENQIFDKNQECIQQDNKQQSLGKRSFQDMNHSKSKQSGRNSYNRSRQYNDSKYKRQKN